MIDSTTTNGNHLKLNCSIGCIVIRSKILLLCSFAIDEGPELSVLERTETEFFGKKATILSTITYLSSKGR